MVGWKKHLLGRKLGQFKRFKAGELLRIKYETLGGYWKVRYFEGVCISRRKHNGTCRYRLLTSIKGTNIEFSFDADNPQVLEIIRLNTAVIKHKARLYYLNKQL